MSYQLIICMRKNGLISLCVLLMTQLGAQSSYTLTQAHHEPIVGDTYDVKFIDTTSALPMSIFGHDVTWNVTGISETGDLNSIMYASPVGNPDAANYPGTTLIQSDNNGITYYKSTTNQLELLGVNTSIFNLKYSTDAAIISSYPAYIGHSSSDLVAGMMKIPTYNLTGPFDGTITVSADATGTLTINGSITLVDCIRIKTLQHVHFNLNNGVETGTIDQVSYSFYNSTSKFPVFSVNYAHLVGSGFATINTTRVQMGVLSSISLGIKETEKERITFKAYPNPAQHEVNLHFVLTQPDSYFIEITNMLGQVVKQQPLSGLQPGSYYEMIDVKGLNAGTYLLKITGKNSQGIEKLIIR